MLESRGLTSPLIERVESFARGHPLALEMAAAAIRTQPNLEITEGPPPKVLQQLTQAFLAGLPLETMEAVEAATTVRRVTDRCSGHCSLSLVQERYSAIFKLSLSSM